MLFNLPVFSIILFSSFSQVFPLSKEYLPARYAGLSSPLELPVKWVYIKSRLPFFSVIKSPSLFLGLFFPGLSINTISLSSFRTLGESFFLQEKLKSSRDTNSIERKLYLFIIDNKLLSNVFTYPAHLARIGSGIYCTLDAIIGKDVWKYKRFTYYNFRV